MSVPSAMSHRPCATAEAEPEEEPPGTWLGRGGIERRAVEGVLAEDPERDLVGDRLADQRRAGVEQALDRPGMARRDRMLSRPVRVAAAGRVAGDVEEILGGERQPGERAAGSSGDSHRWPGDEGSGHEGWGTTPTGAGVKWYGDLHPARRGPRSGPLPVSTSGGRRETEARERLRQDLGQEIVELAPQDLRDDAEGAVRREGRAAD